MGQSESRSLARITNEHLGGVREYDSIARGRSEQIQVIGKRDLNDCDGTNGLVYGPSELGKRRDGPIASRIGRPMGVSPGADEQENIAFKQSRIDLPEQDKHKEPAGSQPTTVAIQDSCCCCYLDHLDGAILRQHSPLEPSPISLKVNTRGRHTKESWILEELDLVAGRSAGQAARDRETIVRIARRVRVCRDGRPRGGDDNNPAQQIDCSQGANLRKPAHLDASESARASAQTNPADDMKSEQPASHLIRHSHKRRGHVSISSGRLYLSPAALLDAKQSERLQQKQLAASQAPVSILLATGKSESAPDKSEILTTQAGLAEAATGPQISARTCECIGTADAGDRTDAINLGAANNAILTRRANEHHRRTCLSNACDDKHAIAEEPEAAPAIGRETVAGTVAGTATSAFAAGEISIGGVSESGQKSGGAEKVQASSETNEVLTSDKQRAKGGGGDPASCNSEQQNGTASKEKLAIESALPADRQEDSTKKKEQQQQQQQQQLKQHQQVSGEKSQLVDVIKEPDCVTSNSTTRRLDWSELATKYGRMTRKGEMLVSPEMAGSDGVLLQARPAARSRTSRLKDSCFCHIVCALLQTIFPIFGAFKDYSLPGDLFADLAAGFTVAILHIPQGMAYGLLSGVEPIHGLYVSFIPVIIMSFMSKSRHVSYGTFAIISMLLVNTIQQVRSALREEQSRMFLDAGLPRLNMTSTSTAPGLVLTDNHRPAPRESPHPQEQKDLSFGNLIGQSASQINDMGTQNYLFDRANLVMAGDGADQSAAAAGTSLSYAYPSNIEILASVCIVCGIVHITMSLMRLGVLSLMFSDQLISSFTTAGAVHVLTSQLPGLFDLSLAPIQGELFKCMRIWWQFTQALVYNGFNQTTGLLSLASITFLLFVKQLIEPRLRARFKRLTCLPTELVLMAIVIGCSSYFKFETNYQVKIVGEVPSGLPEPRVPRLELVPYVIKDAISIALITFAMNLSIAQVYAKKFRYELNANQELFALGTANIISSFFSCFPCASSLSRSSIQSNLNVKSQLCSLFSCCIVVTIICYFAHILHDLPKSTLSCIIVVALKGILMQLGDLYDNWRLSKLDALVWILTFVSVLIAGVTYGLIIGIIASIFMIFLRLLTPQHSILARLPGTDIFVDKDAFADCEEIEAVKIFRFNSALCYLNRTRLKSMIEKLLPGVFPPTGFKAICAHLHSPSRAHPFYESTATTTIANEEIPARVSHLIIDCSALSYCDYSGANTLVELVEDLEARKVAVYLAACPLKLIDMLEKIQGQKDIASRNVYPTISDALGQISYLRRVVVMPTVAPFRGKRAGKVGGSSLTSSSMSRGSELSRQQTSPAAGIGQQSSEPSVEQQVHKLSCILFAPDKGG